MSGHSAQVGQSGRVSQRIKRTQKRGAHRRANRSIRAPKCINRHSLACLSGCLSGQSGRGVSADKTDTRDVTHFG